MESTCNQVSPPSSASSARLLLSASSRQCPADSRFEGGHATFSFHSFADGAASIIRDAALLGEAPLLLPLVLPLLPLSKDCDGTRRVDAELRGSCAIFMEHEAFKYDDVVLGYN